MGGSGWGAAGSERIGVVVPARDEEDRILACLAALGRALDTLAAQPDPPAVRVVVVADRCRDRTAELASGVPGVEVVEGAFGGVGRARAAGVERLLIDRAPDWLAFTDADSRVPADWLVLQAEQLRAGTDLLLGTVRLDEDDLVPELRQRLAPEPYFGDGHPHVFGAHVGVRTTMYRRVGGFADLDQHEDVHLAAAVRAAGGVVVSTGRAPVVTSSRLEGRTPGGLAGFLRGRLAGPA